MKVITCIAIALATMTAGGVLSMYGHYAIAAVMIAASFGSLILASKELDKEEKRNRTDKYMNHRNEWTKL